MFKKRLWSVAALSAAALTIGVTQSNASFSTPASTEKDSVATGSEKSPELSGEVSYYDGDRHFEGSPSPEIDSLGDRIAEFIDVYPEVYSGVSFAPDYSYVEVYVKNMQHASVAKIKAMPETATGALKLVQVGSSQADFDQLSEIINQALANDSSAIMSHGGNPVTDTYEVRVINLEEQLQKYFGSADISENTNEMSNRLLAKIIPDYKNAAGVKVVVLPGAAGNIDAFSSQNDTSPFYMGGKAVMSGGNYCSLGIPVKIGGTRGVLTAGHCTSSYFYSGNGNFIGSQYTTAYPGNAWKYGDWKILSGSSYKMKVFSGGINSSSNLPISYGVLHQRPIGKQLCSSGATTGQICRFIVKSNNTSVVSGGVTSGRINVLHHDGNLDGIRDCGGFQGGDSGGLTYYANPSSPSNMVGSGLVKGGNTYYCYYYVTSLGGVKQWNGSATFQGS